MAIGFNLPNGAFRLNAQEAGGQPDYVKALQSGLQTASDIYKPRKASEDLLAQMLSNKMNKPKAEGAQLSFDTDIGYKQALTNAANRPPQMSGEAAQLFALRNRFPEGSDDRKKIDAMIDLKSRGTNGIQFSSDPDTGAVTFSQGGTARSGGGGNALTTDQDGNKVIVRQPTGATTSSSQDSGSAQAARDAVEPLAAFPYTGLGSELKLGFDYYNASQGDQAAKNRLIDAAASEMIAHDVALNQLRSSKARVTDQSTNRQIKSLKTGWAAGADKVLNNLAPEDQVKARNRYNEWLDKMHQAQDTYAAKGFPIKIEGGQPKVTPETQQAERQKDMSTAKQFHTTPMKVLQARSEGVKTAQQFRDWLRSHP